MSTSWYFVDIETYQMNKETGYLEPTLNANKFVYGSVANHKGEQKFFTEPKRLWEYLLRRIEIHGNKKQNTYIYGHNHEYDFIGYAKHALNELLKEERLLIIRGKPLFAILDRRAYFLDTMSFYPMKLDTAATMVGSKKLELPQKIRSILELNSYLYQDVEATRRLMVDLKEQLQSIGYTINKWTTPGNVAVSAWKQHLKKIGAYNHYFWKGTLWRKLQNFENIRLAYKGGRCEAFTTGHIEHGIQIDANAYYWDIMANKEYPDIRHEKKYVGINWKNIQENIGVVHCTIKLPITKIGLLPFWKKINGERHTLFPHKGETITGTWAINEVKNAIKHGAIIHEWICDWAIVYPNKAQIHPFKSFIENLWKLRRNSDGLQKYALKLLGNSLYGKFGQRKFDKEYKWIERDDIHEWLSKGWHIESATDDYVISKSTEDMFIPKHAHPIYSVLINSYAREGLLNIMLKCEEKKEGSVHYCDTDGIIIDKEVLSEIPISEELGDFKIEAKGEIYIRCEKHYHVGEKVVMGGIPRTNHSKDNIIKGEINIKRMQGLNTLKTGQTHKMGLFEDIHVQLKATGKDSYELAENMIEEP